MRIIADFLGIGIDAVNNIHTFSNNSTNVF